MSHVIHTKHINQLVQVRLDVPGRLVIGVDYDGHTRDAGFLSSADGERRNIERTSSEKRGHPVENAGLVFHINHERLKLALVMISIVLRHLFSPAYRYSN